MGRGNRKNPIEKMPVELLREPLVWFFAEHYRHRDMCKRLLELATTMRFDEEALVDIQHFIETDMPLHIIDEEDDLFPLLRRRCMVDDNIENVLGILSGEHANDMHDASAIKGLIDKAIEERRGLASFVETEQVLVAFCRSQMRHIAVENAVVLPIARLRLSERDLVNLGQRLAARRGLSDPFEAG